MQDRRFWPIFVTIFLGAFNDNLMKSTVVVLVAYGLWDTWGVKEEVLVSIAAGLFILPFLLFCPLAGDLTDKYPKQTIIRYAKVAEIAIVLGAIAALYFGSVIIAFIVLFALGAQSAFFSPAKYSILPQHLKDDELIGGNGLISTGTYIAILSGTIVGYLLALETGGIEIISVTLFVAALVGYGACLYIPDAPPADPDHRLILNPLRRIIQILSYTYKRPDGVFVAMLCVSWFYFVAGSFHTQFPNFTKQSLGADEMVLSFFMIIFSAGIAIGGLLNNRLLKAQVSARLVPWSALGIAVFSADLYFASLTFEDQALSGVLLSLQEFLQRWNGVRITIDLFLLSAMGGIYVVPLRAIVQNRTPRDQCARVVAGNALLDALFLLSSAILATLLLSYGITVQDLFVLLSFATLGLAVYLFFNKSL